MTLATKLMALQSAVEREDSAKKDYEEAKKDTKRLIFDCYSQGANREILAEIIGVSKDRIKQIIREVRPFDEVTETEKKLAEYHAALLREQDQGS